MKVLISQRSVYHKYAEVEIEIPNDWRKSNGDDDYYTHINDYLHDNEELYVDKIDNAMSKAEYEFGFGVDYTGMEEKDSESEWRYDCYEEKTGGHL